MLYPRHEAKADARKAFGKVPESERAIIERTLPLHCERWKALQTEKHFIPLPATWLNGERWTDEIELPQPKLDTPENVLAFAKKANLEARPGETMEEFKQRIRTTR